VSRGAPERKLERVDRYDRRAQVTSYETLTTTGTVRISFLVVDDRPFGFHPGYFVGIQAEDPELGKLRSPYCIVSPPNEERTFQLLVRLVPEGPLSYYLGALQPGDVIKFRGPSGRSMVPREDGTELVLLATGVGVGPLLALAQELLAAGFDRPIRLFWGLRLAEDICLLDELEELAAWSSRPGSAGRFSYDITLSRPPPGWRGLAGRLTEAVPPLLATLGDKHFYLVGNGAMVEEMDAALSDLGVDEQLIYQEAYFNVRHRPDAATLAEIRARFVALDLFSPYAHQEAGLWMPGGAGARRRLPDAATLAEIRARFVALDLFSPYAHQEAGLWMPGGAGARRRLTNAARVAAADAERGRGAGRDGGT